MYTTLISATQLQALIASNTPHMIFDCSFDLLQPNAGEQQYQTAHIPSARYAHLDTALSAKNANADTPASGGRHPLPSREKFASWLRSTGVTNDMQIVVYDRNGTNYCGRLWWMLKWAGHEAVAILDGGLQAWQAAGGAVAAGTEPTATPSNFALLPTQRKLLSVQTVMARLGQPEQTLIDARAPARFRGEVEPMDPVAGHIPGALNRPFSANLQPDGFFKPAAQLRQEFEALLEGRAPSTVVHQCGSGVSALPNLIAMEIAGLGPTALFAGSWSEWCSDPGRPVAQGN